MGVIQRLPGVTFPNTVPKVNLLDRLESPGGLVILDPAHSAGPWNAGLPGSGSTVPNLSPTAAALVGSSAVRPAFWQSNPALTERTSKGGLHMYATAAGAYAYVQHAQSILDYIKAHNDHDFFINLWARTTKAPSIAAASAFFHQVQTNTQFGIVIHGADAIPLRDGHIDFGPTNLMALGMTRLTAMFDPGDLTTPNYFGNKLFQCLPTYGGQVLYRYDLIDQTVDGRSYDELRALSVAAYDQAFGPGGRYADDTFTAIP